MKPRPFSLHRIARNATVAGLTLALLTWRRPHRRGTLTPTVTSRPDMAPPHSRRGRAAWSLVRSDTPRAALPPRSFNAARTSVRPHMAGPRRQHPLRGC